MGEQRHKRDSLVTVAELVKAIVSGDGPGEWRDECFHTVEIFVQVARVQQSKQ